MINQQRTDFDERLIEIKDRTGHAIFYEKNGQPTGDSTARIDPAAFHTLSVGLAHLSQGLSTVSVFNSYSLFAKLLFQNILLGLKSLHHPITTLLSEIRGKITETENWNCTEYLL